MNAKLMNHMQHRPLIALTLTVALLVSAYAMSPRFKGAVNTVFDRNPVTPFPDKAINSAKPLPKPFSQTSSENQIYSRAGEGSQAPVAFDPSRLIPLEKQLSALTKLLESQQQQNETHQQALDARFTALEENLTDLKNQLLKVVASYTPAKAPPQADNKKSLKTTKTQAVAIKQKIIRPPFQLVSLDSWGDMTYPVVRYQGKLHPIKSGSLANWHFDGVNPSGDGVFVLDGTAKKAILTPDHSPG